MMGMIVKMHFNLFVCFFLLFIQALGIYSKWWNISNQNAIDRQTRYYPNFDALANSINKFVKCRNRLEIAGLESALNN